MTSCQRPTAGRTLVSAGETIVTAGTERFSDRDRAPFLLYHSECGHDGRG